MVDQRGEPLESQIKRLADCIMAHHPHEPGRTGASEGAIDVAIRLLPQLAKAQAALQWAVTTLDSYRTIEFEDGTVAGTEHWMDGWADWLEQQARPALAGTTGEKQP